MNTKSLVGLCVTFAFLALPVALLLNPELKQAEPEFVGYRAEFVGQETAEVGEMVRFLAEGEIVRWECLPNTSDSESYGEFNENYVVSFRSPGVYTVIAAIYAENELTIRTQAVDVAGGEPVVVVDPIEPPVSNLNPMLVEKVQGWTKKYKVAKDSALALASNFETVASEIRAGLLSTEGQIITRTAALNSGLKLSEGLMAEIQAYLTSQSDSGSLITVEQHLVVWNSIAKGLRNGAK